MAIDKTVKDLWLELAHKELLLKDALKRIELLEETLRIAENDLKLEKQKNDLTDR